MQPLAPVSLTGSIVGGAGSGTKILQFNHSGGSTFNGAVSGNLSVQISRGNVTFLGNVGPAGGTLLQNGVLTIGEGGALSSALVNQTLLIFDRTTDLVHLSPISGPGRLDKRGPFTLSLADTTYTGSTNVFAGTLILAGSSASPKFSILGASVLEFNVSSGTRDMISTTYTGGSMRKSGAGAIRWPAGGKFGFTGQMFIDAGEFVAGGSGSNNWLDNRASLTVAAGASSAGWRPMSWWAT